MQAPYPPPEADRANELYWGSELSVKQIADELDLSRGALYGLLRPLGAAHPCPECGAEAAWANRTARGKRELTCPGCGWEGRGTEPAAPGRTAAPLAPEGAASARDEEAGASVRDPARARFAAAGALLGAAVGLALVFWSRRR